MNNANNSNDYNSNNGNYNIKKSIGESIRTKVHQPTIIPTTTTMFGSSSYHNHNKGIHINSINTGMIKQSFNKASLKQSISNDSDMDFDL